MAEQFTAFPNVDGYQTAPDDIKEAQKTRDDGIIAVLAYLDHISRSMPEEKDYMVSIGYQDVKKIFKTVLPSIMKSQSAINQYNYMLDEVSDIICDAVEDSINEEIINQDNEKPSTS